MTESHLRLTPKESDILGLKRKLDLAKGIIEKGGRPSIVRAVCQISKASALQFHKEIHGHGPKAGLLPYDPDWITKSPENCLHASIYFNIFQKISRNTTACKGEIYLAAYTLYEQTLMDKPKILNINRAWHIGQQISMSYLCGMTCSRCHSTYVAIREFPDPYKFCPLCDATSDSTGRQKWKQLHTRPRIHRTKRKKKSPIETPLNKGDL
ncbi:FlhC family transcriptional regulator [Methylophaga sp.]|uniref:FlhC family transcriptional regulator n=1 Tax=Methylophaga sp. TaxID=2024840 RepID=UPI00351D4FDF